MTPPVVLATELHEGSGGLAVCAAVAVEISGWSSAERGGALLVEVAALRARRPTLLASPAARELEDGLREAGFDQVAARGRLCWLSLNGEDPFAGLEEVVLGTKQSAQVTIVAVPSALWPEAIEWAPRPAAGLLRADPRTERPLLALAVRELHERGLRARVATRPLARVGARRALAGLAPGGAASRQVARLARGLIGASVSDDAPGNDVPPTAERRISATMRP
jgi:hypothetical protein